MRRELVNASVSLYTEEAGGGQIPVILLHGLFGSASNLLSVSRGLEADYRVVRMDLRNHGKSPHAERMTIADMSADVLAAMDTLGLDRVHILGHSLGGKVAMQLALDHPERVISLIVADIAPVRYRPGHDDILEGLQALDIRAIENRGQADIQLQKYVSELPIRQFLLKNLYRKEDGDWALRMNLKVIAGEYDCLRDAPEGESYTGPSLFIKGERSGYIKEEGKLAIMRQFPGAEIAEIVGAGHWLHVEQAVTFNALVQEFIASHTTP